ncbi:hypothetical protein [Streptomyces sp. Da 82-17]|uniref:hypothetical protein n=1 Tax=Streptomyces sp. Da 82-17 TaxID=3377116 RepID=UPI0038D39C41
MTQNNARRTTFSFAPPVDNPTAWQLRLDHFADRINEGFPGAFTKLKGHLGPRSIDALTFEVSLSEGVWLRGLATTPYPEMGSVLVMDASAGEAARFAVWLRDSYAPAPDLVQFTTEIAMDLGEETPWEVPPHGTAEDLAQVFQQHIDTFDR